jgi:hypothetical protein
MIGQWLVGYVFPSLITQSSYIAIKPSDMVKEVVDVWQERVIRFV